MNKKDPMVSVIIPVYNTEKYLKECIDSVLQQTYQDFEIIIIDDSSTDNSFEICQEYARKDNRVHVFQQKHAGAGKARNLGIEKAQGTYIMFLDSDDYVDKTILEKMLKVSRGPEANGIVLCPIFKLCENGTIELRQEILQSFVVTNPDILFEKYFIQVIKGNIMCYCYRTLFPHKLIIESNSKFGLTNYSEDMIFMLSIAKKMKFLDVISEPLLFRRLHSESLTGKKYRENFLSDSCNYFKQLISIIKDTKFSNQQKEYLIEWNMLSHQNVLIYNACATKNYKRECKNIYNSIFFSHACNKRIWKNWFITQDIGNKFVAIIVRTRMISLQYIIRKLFNK